MSLTKEEVATKTKTKKGWKGYVEIKWRCHLGYCCRACWYCLPPCWGRNLSPLKAFIRALRICLCSSVLQDTHLRGKLLKPSLSFIELLLPWEKIHFKKTPAVKLGTFGVSVFTSAWDLKSVYPKIKQQKLQYWMQETDLQLWVSSPAWACFEGTSFSAERAAVTDPESGWTGRSRGALWWFPPCTATAGFREDAELSRAGRAPRGNWAQAKCQVRDGWVGCLHLFPPSCFPSLPIPPLSNASYWCWGRIREPGASRGSSQSTMAISFSFITQKLRTPISLHSVCTQRLFLWIKKVENGMCSCKKVGKNCHHCLEAITILWLPWQVNNEPLCWASS